MIRVLVISCLLPLLSFGQSASQILPLWWSAVAHQPSVTASTWTPITNLIAHYLFNDNAANTTVLDNWGGTNNGTASMNTSLMHSNGVVNGALFFPTNKTYITINTANPFAVQHGQVSVLMWIRYTTAGLNQTPNSGCFLSANGTGNNYFKYTFYTNAGTSSLYGDSDFGGTRTQMYNTSMPLISAGTWYHIAICRTNTAGVQGDWVMYMNGIQYPVTWSGSAGGSGIPTCSQPTYIGWDHNFNYSILGTLDDFRVYNRGLTSNEVSRIYNGGAGTEQE